MSGRSGLRAPHILVGSLSAGLAASLVLREDRALVAVAAAAFALAALVAGRRRLVALASGLALAGLWWGSARLDHLDASLLERHVGTSDRALVEVTGPARRGPFSVRVPVRVRRFGTLTPDEQARLELPPGRAPPQGALLDVVANVRRPRPADEPGAFDEAAYLRRQGVDVVLRASGFEVVGARGGLGGLGDRLRRHVGETIASGAEGERRALVAGVVLGADEGLEPELQEDFRASGLYHLLKRVNKSQSVPNASSRGGASRMPRRGVARRRLPRRYNPHAALRRDGAEERPRVNGTRRKPD